MLGTGTLFRGAGLGQDAPHRRGDDIQIPILALCFLCLSQTIELTFRTSRYGLAPPSFGVFDGLDGEGFEFGDKIA
jgi:hypothetical protein